MMKAIAIDDEPLPLEILETYCSRLDIIRLERTFTRIGDAKKYLHKFPADLLFLDVQMPMLSGIDFYTGLEQETMVIFTTAHSEYAIEGFNLNAVDYLLKPYSFERFSIAVHKAAELYRRHQPSAQTRSNLLYLRADYNLVQVAPDDILYIESFADYLKITLNGKQPLTIRMTMKSMLEKLSPEAFIRVHRSFIIPFSHIQEVRSQTLLVAGKEIPIGSSYRENLLTRLKP